VSNLKITDVRTICTQPDHVRLIVVKILTSEPGLYGVGCATFTQRADVVVTAIDKYLKPFVIGRDPDDIEDIFQAAYVSSYWRSGPVLNNALSGIDQALWDIKGKRANMPVYQLLGGKCRQFVPVYTHASGRDFAEVEETVRKYMDEGYHYIRAQVAVPGLSTYGSRASGASSRQTWEGSPYCRIVPQLFEHLRVRVGDEIELLHDIHERIPPIQAIALAKELEKYHLFFLEDPFSPEDIDYFRVLRQQTAIPIAMGELFVNQNEYVPLVKDRLIDFMRVHISDIGGLSMARKLAAFCEFFGVRTAWHGPGDVSPVGHAANLALDLACPNFGIQELAHFSDPVKAVFPGCPEVHDGALWPIERPGLGVDVDEKEAAKFPFKDSPLNGGWPEVRRLDGTVVRP